MEAARHSIITDEMKIAAAKAHAGLVGDELSREYIIPAPFDPRAASEVAKAVSEAAKRTGTARQ